MSSFRYKVGMKAFRQRNCCRGGESHRPRTSLPRGGFSLIELLIVLALILILSTSYYSWGGRDEQLRQRHNCESNLQKIYIALQIYANDHAGTYPVVTNANKSEEPLALLVPRYDSDLSIFICPASGDSQLPPGASLLANRISYAYYMGLHSSDAQAPLMSDAQVDTSPKNVGEMAFSATGRGPGNNHQKSGGNVLFGDGHAEFSRPAASFSLVYPQGVVLLNPKP
jgi:prepilin-type N-terminal cleavage/methylation domain-containing protein/prepilin-type processing-associated H-X9-DG protein